MNSKKKILLLGIAATAFYYLINSFLDCLFIADKTFLESFISDIPVYEILKRLTGMVLILILTFLARNHVQTMRLQIWPKNKRGKFYPDLYMLTAIYQHLKIPLNVISGFSNLIENDDIDKESRKKYLRYIHENSRSLLQLIDNMTDLFMIETDQISVKKEKCALRGLLEEIRLAAVSPDDGSSGTRYELKLENGSEDPELTIITDIKRLKKVFSNLINNAMTAEDERQITIGYQVKGNLIEFYVRYIKNYISLDRIAGKSKKERVTMDQSKFETAVMMAVTRIFIQLMGGDSRIEKSDGKYTFYFSMPAHFALSEKSQPIDEPVDRKHTWNNRTILVVEDIESNYVYLKELLKPYLFKIIWAKNGREAVEIFKREKSIELVLMDILMPEMDGYEASGLIKKINADIPIIVQTAYSLDNEPLEKLAFFDDYLVKPIWSNELISMLKKHMPKPS